MFKIYVEFTSGQRVKEHFNTQWETERYIKHTIREDFDTNYIYSMLVKLSDVTQFTYVNEFNKRG